VASPRWGLELRTLTETKASVLNLSRNNNGWEFDLRNLGLQQNKL
jgi:hypothetical protein